MPENMKQKFTSPAELTAILVAAHRTGDVALERAAKRQLEEKFAIHVSFRSKKQEVANAS